MSLLMVALMAMPSSAADTYTPAPLQLLTARVDEHEQQICDLDERIRELEKSVVKESLITAATVRKSQIAADSGTEIHKAVVLPAAPQRYDYDGALIVTGSERIIQKTVLVTAPRTPIRTVARAVGRRLRTRSELSAAIRASWTNRVYARMADGQDHLVYIHLTGRHGYASAQVSGLALSEALMLHNLAHGPRVNGYVSTTYVSTTTRAGINCANGQCATAIRRVDVFVPTPRGGRGDYSPPRSNGNCANGQCDNRGSARSGGGWFPGKLLFGR